MKRQSPSSCPSWNFEIDDGHEPVAKRPRCFVSSPTQSLDESNEINEDDTNNEAEESIITTATINEESQIGISIGNHTVLDDDNDDEIIEIEREDLANGIVIVSDSELEDNDDDQEIDVTDEIPPSVSSIFSPENDDIEVVAEVIQDEQVIVDEEIDTTTDYDDDDNESLEIIIDNINSELIDLTDDEPNPNSYSPDSVERKLSTDVQQCPICLETLSDLQQTGVYLIITRCHHVMCTLCCRQLLATSSRCPLCRENVSVTSLMPYCILT